MPGVSRHSQKRTPNISRSVRRLALNAGACSAPRCRLGNLLTIMFALVARCMPSLAHLEFEYVPLIEGRWAGIHERHCHRVARCLDIHFWHCWRKSEPSGEQCRLQTQAHRLHCASGCAALGVLRGAQRCTTDALVPSCTPRRPSSLLSAVRACEAIDQGVSSQKVRREEALGYAAQRSRSEEGAGASAPAYVAPLRIALVHCFYELSVWPHYRTARRRYTGRSFEISGPR